MKVSKLMTKNLVIVGMDDSLVKIKKLFDTFPIHHLLVVEGNTLFGLISDRDLLKHLNPRVNLPGATEKDLVCLSAKAHQIMSHEPITLNQNATGQQAVAIFNKNAISCIPIVNDKGEPVGILTIHDILKAVGKPSQ